MTNKPTPEMPLSDDELAKLKATINAPNVKALGFTMKVRRVLIQDSRPVQGGEEGE